MGYACNRERNRGFRTDVYIFGAVYDVSMGVSMRFGGWMHGLHRSGRIWWLAWVSVEILCTYCRSYIDGWLFNEWMWMVVHFAMRDWNKCVGLHGWEAEVRSAVRFGFLPRFSPGQCAQACAPDFRGGYPVRVFAPVF